MKFAKVLQQTLVEEDIPEEWVEAAIKYKSLKKCITKVVRELKFLGLEQNTLKFLLEDPNGEDGTKKIIEVDQNETLPNNPIIAEYTLTKSNDKSKPILPYLKITLNYDDDEYTDDHIHEVGLQLKHKIEMLLNNDDFADDDHEDPNTEQQVIEIKEEGDKLILSPQTTHSIPSRLGSPEPFELNNSKSLDKTLTESKEPVPKQRKTNEIVIMLNSDTKFFQMLNKELESLDDLKSKEESNLISQVESISHSVKSLSSPNVSLKKTDLYKWRELFKIYLDSEVYFKYNQTNSSASERNAEQIKKNLQEFVNRVTKSGITDQFKKKKSLAVFNQFIAMNYHLLKVLQFQSINTEAFRKILKKFDKQTSLNVKNRFPKLINDDHVFFSGASLAQSICYIMQTSILTLIPQLDDYTCPICTSVAFKPIKLSCGHVFCVRCLVKLKQQDKSNCPICRHEDAVVKADSTNLDLKSMALMKTYFPVEVKEKLKERDKERYDEVVGKEKCIIM